MPLLEDIDKDTVDFTPNYDESKHEPSVLPARFPNLLVNGAGGIAVGMATNMPPHNLGEVIDGCLAFIDNPDISAEELIEIIPGPDFPTGALILGRCRRALGLHDGPRLDHHAGQVRDRGGPQGSRGDHLHRDSLSGEQGVADREDRRAGAREEDRGHLRPARRIRPRRHAHRHRDQARRHGGRGAEPALPLHAAADELRRQHGGAERRPAGADDAEGPDPGLRRLPRGGRLPPHQVPAQQGARARPRAVRPCHRGRQYRRGHPPHPHRARSERRPRSPDGPRLAGARHRAADRARRRSAPQDQRRRHLPPLRDAGPRHPRPAPAAPDRSRPRRDRRRAVEARRRDLGLPRHPALARPHHGHHQGRADRDPRRLRHAAPDRRSWIGTPTSTTRT